MLSSLVLSLAVVMVSAEDYVHSPIQYHTQSDSGTYNYGYDTGLYGSHQFHQEHKDTSGQVRGRYGYTDPYGKLRVVYYSAGPQGFRILKDTGTSPPDRHVGPKPDLGTVNTIERYQSPARTPNRPFSFHPKPLQSVASRPVPRRKPTLSRTYRESGSENSRFYVAGRDYGNVRPNRFRQPYSEERPIVRVESPRSRSQFHRATAVTRPDPIPVRPTSVISVPSRSASSNYDHLHKPYSYEVPVSAPETHVRESVSVSHVPTVHNGISNHIPDSIPSAPYTSEYRIPPVVLPAQPIPVRPPVVYSGRGIQSPSARLRALSGIRSPNPNPLTPRIERSSIAQ